MTKRYWSALLLVFIALDLVLTYWQNYQLPLDGDLVGTVLPAPWYSKILQDPFGWAVLTKNEVYAGTNRFFAHATMSWYWKQVPHLLQRFTAPINSLYVASALFNTVSHALILFALAAYVRLGGGEKQPSRQSYWLAAALLVPLFQNDGFYEQMGITNLAITYTFFYAFPTGLLLLLLWPFYRAAYWQEPLRLRPVQVVLLVLLMVVIAFNGPIPVASVAVLLLGIGAYWVRRQWPGAVRPPETGPAAKDWLSGQALALLGVLAALSAYSLYIGRNNAENSHTHTLWQLYQLLPTGFWRELTLQWGLPLLLVLLLVNTQLVRRLVPASVERQRVLSSVRWVGLFALVFILLLPFGGYRNYRPYVIRGDSILPVLIGLFYAYGVSTYFLLHQLRGRRRNAYAVVVVLFAATFVYADRTITMPYTNDCERWALDQMARSPEPVVRISTFCNVLTWGPVLHDPNQTELQAEMLYRWGVTDRKKPYYQE